MSQEIDQLAARVAGMVRDEVAAAELRGRSAGHAAGQEEMRREMAALQADNDRLNTRCTQLEAELEEQRRLRPAGVVDEEGGPFEDSSPEARAERMRLREQRIIDEHEKSETERLLRDTETAAAKARWQSPAKAVKK